MKCQRCPRPATIHITEIVHGKPLEYHLCEEHARAQLTNEEPAEPATAGAKALAKLAESKITAELDRRTCPVCGISFREFRSKGRLGCSNDYEAFESELLPLLENIHGETQHTGKVPSRLPADRRRHAELVKLRQALKKAVAEEKYETAARLRDRIKEMEEAGKPSDQ